MLTSKTKKTPAYRHLLVELPLGGLVDAVGERGRRVLVDQTEAVHAADGTSALLAQPTARHKHRQVTISKKQQQWSSRK